MTTGNMLQKIIAVFLVFLLCCCCLPSCQQKTEDLPFEQINTPLEVTETGTPFSLYRLVVPVTCSPALFAKAQELSQKLFAQTGVVSEVVYDREATIPQEGVIEILLGNCDRELSKQTLSRLRYNDYLCRVHEATVVLGGKNDQATISAIHRFCSEFLPYATAYSFLPPSAEFLHRAEYPIDSILLNGFDLSEYHIVFAEDESEQIFSLAIAMQSILCENSGYDLSVVSSQNHYEDHKQIHLKLVSDETMGTARILTQEQGISLVAHDAFGLSSAVRLLCEELLSPNVDGSVIVTTAAVTPISYQNTPQSFASLFLPSPMSGATEITRLADMVQDQSPNIVLTGKMSDTQHNAVGTILSQKYPFQGSSELFQKENIAQFLSDLSEQMNQSAKLYQIGNDTEGFLLLTLEEVPTESLPASLQARNLPLLILIHTKTETLVHQPPFWSDTHFENVLFESYSQDETPCLFTVYAETDSFCCTKNESAGGYRSFTVNRISAFYPTP